MTNDEVRRITFRCTERSHAEPSRHFKFLDGKCNSCRAGSISGDSDVLRYSGGFHAATYSLRREHAPDDLIKDFADVLERDVLAGQIRVNRASAGGYPDFVYQPWKTKENIRLARASSMVTELAPIVLFLRGVIARGDMLIIDEPEAHLHPQMQVEFTRLLASIVRSGVRIILTTHSEWVLEELANLVQASELSKSEREAINDSDIALKEDEVGAWLFGPRNAQGFGCGGNSAESGIGNLCHGI